MGLFVVSSVIGGIIGSVIAELVIWVISQQLKSSPRPIMDMKAVLPTLPKPFAKQAPKRKPVIQTEEKEWIAENNK